MVYLEEDDFDALFAIIYRHYSGSESAPTYRDEQDGIELLRGVANGVQSDTYYPALFDKATYILIQINKGHFFSNGNKRLALAFTLIFLFVNGYGPRNLSKDAYRNQLYTLFPFDDFQDYSDFTPEDFGYYNLSIVIADSNHYVFSFEELKTSVRRFLEFSLEEQ